VPKTITKKNLTKIITIPMANPRKLTGPPPKNALQRIPHGYAKHLTIGFKTLKLNSQTYHRKEETILHEITKKIYLSLFVPETCFKKIILYLHGNSSSKVEGKSLLPYLPKRVGFGFF
jgi:hypothetical protein